MSARTKLVKCDLSYTYQDTSLGLEIRSQDELDVLVEALNSEETTMVHLHNQHRNIELSIYLRFREGAVTAQQEETEAAK